MTFVWHFLFQRNTILIVEQEARKIARIPLDHRERFRRHFDFENAIHDSFRQERRDAMMEMSGHGCEQTDDNGAIARLNAVMHANFTSSIC